MTRAVRTPRSLKRHGYRSHGSAMVCEPQDGDSPFCDRWGPHYAEDVSAGFKHGRDEGGFLIFTCEACGVQAKEVAVVKARSTPA